MLLRQCSRAMLRSCSKNAPVSLAVKRLSTRFYSTNDNAKAEPRNTGVTEEGQHTGEDREWHKDHRTIGQRQELYSFHEWSPGQVFFQPHGIRVYNSLVNYIRNECIKRGYEEVMTPLMFNKKLWEISGHWQNYKQNMFTIQEKDSNPVPQESHTCNDPTHSHSHSHSHANENDSDTHGLKPMNCPGHCLLFASKVRSYRELPIRWMEFSPLHRNEASGALGGLTRLRQFHQDDAHVFCMQSQLLQETTSCLELLADVYKTILGLDASQIQVFLSTRPDEYIGNLENWERAETALAQALNNTIGEGKWGVKEGDGAFYGPKIDVHITDSRGRSHQCATIQLDMQLPLRFGLKYMSEQEGVIDTPVIIHRAMFGSVERFMAITSEHFEGRWPFWLSPCQAVVIPISDKCLSYAQSVARTLVEGRVDSSGDGIHGYGNLNVFVDVDTKFTNTIDKRVREASMKQYNYILVVGKKEEAGGSVSVRTRANTKPKTCDVSDLVKEFRAMVSGKTRD